MSVAVDYQVHRTAVDLAKGYRQLEKAAKAADKGNDDSVARHLGDALNDYSAAVDHAAKAVDDACNKAGTLIGKGNAQLQKAIDSYSNGHPDVAEGHYDSAVSDYSAALDLIDPD
jgi:hypothetical protein